MRAVHKKAALSDDRRSAATEHQGCACEKKCNPCQCGTQAEQTTNRIESEDARWRANNFCADCGAYVADGFAACSSQKAHRRGPVWCEECFARKEMTR